MKPILMSTPMVLALKAGGKTMTRRIIKPQYHVLNVKRLWTSIKRNGWWHQGPIEHHASLLRVCPYQVGDVLWCRETWQHTKCLNLNHEDDNYGYVYRADGQPWEDFEGWKWKPSIFMPKEAARIFLKVTSVKVEQVQDISDEDCKSEGIVIPDTAPKTLYHKEYAILWNHINGKGSWESNPWVWVYSFTAYPQ